MHPVPFNTIKRLRDSQSEAFISTGKWFLPKEMVRKCFCKETKGFSRQKVQKLFVWVSAFDYKAQGKAGES